MPIWFFQDAVGVVVAAVVVRVLDAAVAASASRFQEDNLHRPQRHGGFSVRNTAISEVLPGVSSSLKRADNSEDTRVTTARQQQYNTTITTAKRSGGDASTRSLYNGNNE